MIKNCCRLIWIFLLPYRWWWEGWGQRRWSKWCSLSGSLCSASPKPGTEIIIHTHDCRLCIYTNLKLISNRYMSAQTPLQFHCLISYLNCTAVCLLTHQKFSDRLDKYTYSIIVSRVVHFSRCFCISLLVRCFKTCRKKG